MEPTFKLILMVGLPRSGKSTHALELGFPIVNPDAIRLAIHGEAYIQAAEPYVWAIANTMARALFNAGHNTVIIDACNNTRKRRDDWTARKLGCRKEDLEREFIEFDTSVDTCVARAMDGREDLIPIIKRMAEQHEHVDADERV